MNELSKKKATQINKKLSQIWIAINWIEIFLQQKKKQLSAWLQHNN